ncbi:metal ABC transporter substrate-binding protein [Ferdinandcohnia quinoae]|uniref:Metal ABC transporter substrate-binding protein n=1 Tax=Fredinandcohnia quinoae TaxID=2918902 RepID=A0AAW5DXM9_9BACI|nr:metal ABC transporter substrate-binding protein [Fredinandcohnia sp. SECRCQ15]MCH1625427.1 metal ABC transporter substrate-binding protein [Fredinandcohnia sp. SECRCQ15]
MKAKLYFVLSVLLLCSFLTACEAGKNEDENKSNKLMIYTTVFPLTDFTKKIGGDHVFVESVYPPGSDAHSFEPTPKEMTEIADADAFIYTGVGVEGFVTTAQKTLKNEKVKLIEAGKNIEYHHSDEGDHAHEDEDNHDHHKHGDIDPHVWLDPVLSITLAENIKEALSDLHPEFKDEFEQNFQSLKIDLEKLDQEFKQIVDRSKTKEILVAHAAYGYWEERYGIEQNSITGLSPSEEPSQKELKEIIEWSKEHEINYVIFEKNVTSKIAKVIQNEIGVKSLTLHNLESITEKETKNNEDYFSLMRKNSETLKKALN